MWLGMNYSKTQDILEEESSLVDSTRNQQESFHEFVCLGVCVATTIRDFKVMKKFACLMQRGRVYSTL